MASASVAASSASTKSETDKKCTAFCGISSTMREKGRQTQYTHTHYSIMNARIKFYTFCSNNRAHHNNIKFTIFIHHCVRSPCICVCASTITENIISSSEDICAKHLFNDGLWRANELTFFVVDVAAAAAAVSIHLSCSEFNTQFACAIKFIRCDIMQFIGESRRCCVHAITIDDSNRNVCHLNDNNN